MRDLLFAAPNPQVARMPRTRLGRGWDLTAAWQGSRHLGHDLLPSPHPGACWSPKWSPRESRPGIPKVGRWPPNTCTSARFFQRLHPVEHFCTPTSAEPNTDCSLHRVFHRPEYNGRCPLLTIIFKGLNVKHYQPLSLVSFLREVPFTFTCTEFYFL